MTALVPTAMVFIHLTALVVLTHLVSPGGAQTVAQQTTVSTEGREFLIYPSRVPDLWDRINLYITTQSAKLFKVRIFTPKMPVSQGGVDYDLQVSADKPINLEFTTRGSNGARGKLLDGVRVLAEDDIAVFVNNPSSNATGVTAILTTASLGTKYIFPSIRRTFDGQVSICIGNLDQPNAVRITLPRAAGHLQLMYRSNVYLPGDTITVLLNDFEFADIRDSSSYVGKVSVADLTGAEITAERPIAVFSAAVFYPSVLLWSVSRTDKDIVIENIPPVSSWGQKFVVTASPSATAGDYVRVLASQPKVTVHFSDQPEPLMLRSTGEFLERSLEPGTSLQVTADRPVGMIQYRSVFEEDSAPFLFFVPPLENYGNHYTVPMIFNEQFLPSTVNYVILVTHVCHADRVVIRHNTDSTLNGPVSTMTSWRQLGDGPYVTSHVKVKLGFVSIYMSPSSDAEEDKRATLGGYFFGRGPQKAYAAPLGLYPPDANKTFTWVQPRTPAMAVQVAGQVVQGRAVLVLRDKLPLSFSLEAAHVTSAARCHHRCWSRSDCALVAYARGRQGSGRCQLYTAAGSCSGVREAPGFRLYQLMK
ncbi:uncharacterized protein LOC112553142 [Pomacea canaliculata]|uniref:uncharacterized protein LOC112553142 n=1 Tax=Pomacea canaliculata TaxID=400727 RepID=UPI000D72B64F|nr:uncharacterized protein LOC112553142 [Pomacea canaliculata]